MNVNVDHSETFIYYGRSENIVIIKIEMYTYICGRLALAARWLKRIYYCKSIVHY